MISLINVHRHYTGGGREVRAVDGVSLAIAPNEFVALNGPSGCGKSTLMHLIAGLDRPTSGQIFVNGLALHDADENAITHYRRHQLGIVFQFFNLLPTMSALENVMFPLLLQGGSRQESEQRASQTLALFGLADRADHFAHQLSGGEQQRVAIARAIAKRPDVLLCDEPTGALDVRTGIVVLEAIERVNRELGTLTVVITHNAAMADMADRVIYLSDGRVHHLHENRVRAPASSIKW